MRGRFLLQSAQYSLDRVVADSKACVNAADAAGWVSVDPATTQHTKFSNIFSLGDASSMPNSKTAAAITAQAPVLVDNLRAAHDGKELVAKYDGYASCPLLTGHDELMCVPALPSLLVSLQADIEGLGSQARRVQVRRHPQRDFRPHPRIPRRPEPLLLPPQEGLFPSCLLVCVGQGASFSFPFSPLRSSE